MALALILAGVATLGVFLYVRGLEKEKTGAETVEVVVSKADILAGTDLDDLLKENGFTTIEVSEDALVPGAVTRLAQLKGETTSVPILEGEQITRARLAGSEELPGGTLGIPKGHEGLSIALESPRVAAGAIAGGDRIRILATFDNAVNGNPVTVVLVPDVLVLEVTGQEEASDDPGKEQIITMALEPRDAQKVVFAQEKGSVWMSLLPPDEAGTEGNPIGLGQVIM